MAKSKNYTPNDHRSIVRNPNNSAHHANYNNRNNQMNPNHSASKSQPVKSGKK